MAEIADVVAAADEIKLWLAVVVIIFGAVILAAAFYFMVPKVTTITASDVTSVVTAITTMVGTLVGTVLGYQTGSQGRGYLVRQNTSMRNALNEVVGKMSDAEQIALLKRHNLLKT